MCSKKICTKVIKKNNKLVIKVYRGTIRWTKKQVIYKMHCFELNIPVKPITYIILELLLEEVIKALIYFNSEPNYNVH